MLKTCPDPVDVQDLQFKLQCRFKVFDNKELSTFSQSPSLISCASRYGLLFVGSNTSNLQAIQLKCMENYSPKDKDVVNYPRRNIALSSPPKHICVNCDSTILAVVIEKDKCPSVIFYDVLSFLKQNVKVIKEARLSSTPDVFVTETNWNPAIPSIFTACKSDGTLAVYEIKDNSIDINELPKAAEATSFCWSPKGKQIAVGSKNGKITQYKPDLKAVKIINEPPLEGAHSLISLQWVSNYQFIGIYQSAEAEGMAKLIVVDAPKTGDVSYTNYEDICYSGTSRPPQFYMILEQQWSILLVVSSNSTELGVLASTGDTWTQWIISDSARAELPLSADHQETLPVGLALDISPTKSLPWNESSIPPCPYLLILSHQGVLCVFNVVNLKEGVPSICTSPDPISDTSGVQQFVTTSDNISAPKTVTVTVKTTQPAYSLPAMKIPAASQPPAFGGKTLIQPQPAFAAAGSLFQTKVTENKPLFGGQATLTPIKPQQQTTQASLFGGQTLITPISKPLISPAPTTSNHNINAKYSSIFSSLNTLTPTPVTSQSKPIVISALSVSKSEPSAQQEEATALPKPRTLSGKLSETKTAIDMKIRGETDALLAQMIRDECLSLESELKVLLHHGRALRIDVGSDVEKIEMVSKIESLQEFIKEIVDISIGENAEVHCLKQNLIQSWAWFEEARSRYNSSKDEAMTLLLRSQPLDSSTEKKQTDIRKLMYYLESQITQASKALDEQWDNFQDYAKKTHRMQMPTMETIFQTMVRQNAILQKQSYILKDIASRLKSKTRSNNGPSLLLSIENTKDLEDNLKRLQLENPQDINQIQYERVLRRMKNLSVSKTNKLRDLLKNREISHVTAAKPQLPPSLMLQSPESKTKQLISNLLSLESQLSPVKKASAVPRQLTFLHSTPLREPTADIEPTETPPNTPQTDLKYFTFKKIEKSDSAANLVTTASGFVPLAKSSSVFNNLSQVTTSQSTLPMHTFSAFVPTTQVTFSTSKPISFSLAATTTTTVLKTVMTTGADTTSTFTLGTTSTALPKFGATGSAPSTMKTSTPTVKTTVPQFSFGHNLSITPVSTPKKPDAVAPITTILGSVSTAKPIFSFGGTSSIFDAKADSSVAGKTTTTTTVAPIFGGLSQSSKPLFGAPSSLGTFTFGAGSSPSKGSAFSAVTTSTPSSAAPVTPLKSEVSTSLSTSEVTVVPVTQSSIFGGSLNVATADSTVSKTITPMFGSSESSTTTPGAATTTKAASLFGNAASSAKPQLLFETATTAVSTTTAGISSSFGSSLATTKPLSGLATTPPVTIQPAVGSSGSPAFSVPTVASVKPIVSNTSATASSTNNTLVLTSVTTTGESTKAPTVISNVAANTAANTSAPSLFVGTKTTSIFGSVSTTSEATTTQTPSVFGSSIASSTVKPSIFGSGPASTQPSIFDASTSKTPQTSIFASPTTTSQSLMFGTPATVTTTSVFGVAPTTTQPSIFGTSNTSTTPSSIFATTRPSIYGTPTTTTSGTSIFGGTTATTQPSIFGATATTTSSSIFGAAAATTQPSVFGTSTITATSAPIFGATTAVTQPSVFGTSTAAASTSSIFGGVGTTQPSIFGTSPSVATTKPSIFAAAASSTQPSMFGANTTQTSIFGTAAGSATSQTSIFGGGASTSTTKASIFGATTSAPVAQSSVFGTNSVPSTQSSPFSVTPNTAASPFGSAFGSAPTSAPSSPFGQSSSIFGAPKTSASPFGTTFGSPSVFGAPPATTASIFGQPATFGSATPSVFGTPTTSANVFGSTTNGGSTFGAVSSSNNVFGSPVVSSPSFSFAGAANNAGNTGSFGFGNLNVGTATTNSTVFGSGATFGQSATPPANPFGRTVEQKSPFGGSSGIFGSPTSTSSSVFGSNTGSVFGSNTQSGFGTSTFGSSSTFGQQPTFGQSTFSNTSFGSPQPGPFSSGGAGVGQTGFGSPSSFQKTSGFGSPPVFGGSPQPAFGASPNFGGSPAFGAAPTFGSPTKIFGSNTPTGGFGGAASTNTGFGSLANQNTVGFGNLAQQASSPNATPFSGSSSFSSWR